MGFSKPQKKAIETESCSILLSAAAGSGKTTVMINRILRLVQKEKCTLDHMLVLTFTRAAAASMRTKLEDHLNRLLLEAPEDPALLTAARELPTAQISTFDAFCAMLVRRYYFLLDIQADFLILDKPEQELLENEAAEAAIEQASAQCEAGEFPELTLLYDYFSKGKDDRELVLTVQRLAAHCSFYPDPLQRLKAVCAGQDPERFGQSDLLLTKKQYVAGRDALEQARKLCDLCKSEKDRQTLLSIVESDCQTYENILSASNMQELSAALRFVRLKNVKDDIYEEFKALRDYVKEPSGSKRVSDMLKEYKTMDAGVLAEADNILRALGRLTESYIQILRALCLARNVRTFSETLRLAVTLLDHPTVIEELHKEYQYIFVDEDQDSNRLQRYMVDKLANPHADNLFMVGDIKQSVYLFRNAEPQLFLEKIQEYSIVPGEHAAQRVLRLNNNFRSHENVLDCVNTIFAHNMKPDFYEIDYSASEQLYPPPPSDEYQWQTDSQQALPTHVVLIEPDVQESRSVQEIEAQKIVALCKTYLQSTLPDGVGQRKVTFGDIAVLHRSANAQSNVFAKAFQQAGIPLRVPGQDGLLQSYEVAVVADLLRLLDNRRNDYALFSVMQGLYNFTLDELTDLRLRTRDAQFCDCVLEAKDEKTVAFLAELDRLRFLCACRPIWKVVWEIYRTTGFLARCAALPNGQMRTENLRTFAAYAEKYCGTDGMSLSAFLDLIDATDIKLTDGEAEVSGNTVHLLTIHKSKGLEFPIVIVAGCGDDLFSKADRNKLRLSRSLGGALNVKKNDVALCPWAAGATSRLDRFYERSENLRLLYVAGTRAINQLVFTGVVKQTAFLTGLDACRVHASCFFDFIVPPLLVHKDGQALSSHYDLLRDVHYTRGSFTTEIVPSGCISQVDVAPTQMQVQPVSPQQAEAALARMQFTYAHAAATTVRSKRGASDTETNKDYALEPPAFLNQYSAAGVGSAYHLLLEHTDFKEPPEVTLDRLLRRGLLEPGLAKRLNLTKLSAMLQSQTGRELAGRRIQRETPFTMLAQQAGEQYLVQGVIDCYYVDQDGQAVLFDFKSDRVHGNLEELCARYRPQLEMYKQALDKCFGITCKRASLYFLDIEKRVDL